MNLRPVIRTALACSLGLVLAAPASAAEPASGRSDTHTMRDCIDPGASWVPYDDHTILVRSPGRAFKITTARCQRLADPLPIINTKIRGGSSICSARDVQLYVADSADRTPTPCFIQSITPLTEDEAKAIEHSRH